MIPLEYDCFFITCFQDIDDKASPVSKAIKSGRKRVRREAIVGPGVDKDVVHEAVGVKPSSLVPKEIPVIKKQNPVLQVIIFSIRNHFLYYLISIYACVLQLANNTSNLGLKRYQI